MSNDYTKTAEDVQTAIQVTETAYYDAQDDEDQATLQEAIDLLVEVKERAEKKAVT